jgi:Holliday junction resolvase
MTPKAGYQKRRSDGNQPEIVAQLRSLGCTVQILSGVGHGCPDIIVGWHGKNYLFEIKMPGGQITPDEKEFAQYWKGQSTLIRNAEQAIAYMTERDDE